MFRLYIPYTYMVIILSLSNKSLMFVYKKQWNGKLFLKEIKKEIDNEDQIFCLYIQNK
jgi:hypothetical protein